MPDPIFYESLIKELQTLAARPVRNRKELKAWQNDATRLERSFTPEQADEVPSFVWHYLGDADIRSRNSGYRAQQEHQLERVLRELRAYHQKFARAEPG